MAYLLLLVSLIAAIVAAWQGWFGWDEAAAANTQWLLALKVAVLAGIPYIVARSLSEIVGLHQRQQVIELLGRQLQIAALLAEKAEKDARNAARPASAPVAPVAPPSSPGQ